MKKRRELDALVGNGKLRRKCRGSGQELLRPNSGGDDDTDSSETEFTVPTQKAIIRKRSRSNVCTTCLTVSGFLVLVACLVACGTLLWMHFALRKNLDYFQKKLETVERKNQFTPEEFQKLHTQIQELNKTLNNYKSGKNGLQAILYNVTLLTKDIATLKENSASLQKSLAKAPSLESLPTEVETMSKSLRSQGSDLAALKTQVEKDFLVDTANFENITASMKELRAEIKQLQIEKGHADNFTYDFTRLTTQFQEDLNSTEVKLKDQILQLQKQFYIFESQLNETTTAANTTTTTTSTDVTTSTTNPPTNSIPSSTAKAVSKK
ncbi:EF-hand calcium-binding domain-containing protein 14 isoform X1 [Octopus bimaculoides]|uniref:EF-hand domain-containing protein n=1 Tax=Octopus bimaculoides TaxID=37653 RepID=A0A0L8I4X2_OCTBM|nr:EF-hand calcium-binding domain-containing protein 14 isoform X1 [Octopus bimaculoides]XP_014790810.1 EF-hand calcium-binding domain-containing protein 14 isoform X1 [Octopus bimaculoides]|eukprot:XP_014790809.1 PREDICTED: EF-hand calcium-binding domain-containing protein 14-like isoform X1 [Octopus bimaculoides]